jgi:hypothetical protein
MRHSMAWPRNCTSRWRIPELLAGRDAYLQLHDVNPRHELGHRMLHLQPRVDLDEVELALVVQELEGAGAFVAQLAAGFGAALGGAQAAPLADVQGRGLPPGLSGAAVAGSNPARPGGSRS